MSADIQKIKDDINKLWDSWHLTMQSGESLNASEADYQQAQGIRKCLEDLNSVMKNWNLDNTCNCGAQSGSEHRPHNKDCRVYNESITEKE